MKKNIFLLTSSLLVFIFILNGCVSEDKSDPAEVTFEYLKALSEKDKTKVITLSCKAWDEQASLEVDALLSVGAALNNVHCNVTGTEGDFQLVKCSGMLDLTYSDEIRSIDLSSQVYSMGLEDGQWRVCSYK